MNLFLFLFFFIFTCFCQILPINKFNQKSKELNNLIEKNEIYKAISLAKQLSKNNYPDIKKKLFLLYLKNEQYKLAEEELENYIDYQIDEIENQYLKALFLFHKEDFKKSKNILINIFEKKSTEIKFVFVLFKINFKQKNFKEVKNNLREMIKIDHQSPMTFECLMDYYLKITKDFKLAHKTIKNYKKELNGKFIYFLKYADYFYSIKKFDFALVYINSALKFKKKENRAMHLKYQILKKYSFEKLRDFLVEEKNYFQKKKLSKCFLSNCLFRNVNN